MERIMWPRWAVFGALLLGLVAGCMPPSVMSGYNPMLNDAASPSASVAGTGVPPGTEIQFAKAMHPAFAAEFAGCDIVTFAEFVASGTGAWMLSYPMNDKVVFRCRAPGQVGEKNPLSGEAMADFVVVPKEKSDIVFAAKPGELLKLRGGTSVTRQFPASPLEIVFEAITVERCATPANGAKLSAVPGVSTAGQRGKTDEATPLPPIPAATSDTPPASTNALPSPKTSGSRPLDDLLK